MAHRYFSSLVFLVVSLSVPLHETHAVGANKGPIAKPGFAITGQELSQPYARAELPEAYSLGPGDSILYTRYDFESNGSPNRNLIHYSDSVLALARMSALNPGHDDRGTWTSCTFDGGTTWQPLTKIDSTRTGWPNIDQYADEGGTESVVSHASDVPPMLHHYASSDLCGTSWNGGSTGIELLWPRLAIGAGSGIHVVYSEGVNPVTNVLYSHSPDGGITWDVVNMAVTGAPGFVPAADGYDVTAQGNNVAMVVAGHGGDVILITSDNGGATWIEQIIYDIDETLNTPQEVPDGSCSVLFDLLGDLHVAWGSWYSAGDGLLYYSLDAGIRHWSAATGIQEIALPIQDPSIVAPAGGRDGNFASGPDIAVDAEDNVYVIYSVYLREKDVNNNHYEHVFGLGSTDGGSTWTTSIDLTPGSGFDASFPSIADRVGENLSVLYNCDPYAGNAILGDHPEIDVAIMYLRVQKNSIIGSPTSVRDEPSSHPESFGLFQNYPNPFNSSTVISLQLTAFGHVNLGVFDLLGREVATLANEELEPGVHTRQWDAKGFPSGVYVYRLQSGNFTESRKLILMK